MTTETGRRNRHGLRGRLIPMTWTCIWSGLERGNRSHLSKRRVPVHLFTIVGMLRHLCLVRNWNFAQVRAQFLRMLVRVVQVSLHDAALVLVHLLSVALNDVAETLLWRFWDVVVVTGRMILVLLLVVYSTDIIICKMSWRLLLIIKFSNTYWTDKEQDWNAAF